MEAFARTTDPSTSHEAAASMTEPVINRLEQMILDAMGSNPDGMTSDEIRTITGLAVQTQTPRFATLVRKGRITASGKRAGDSGRKQTIWRTI